MKTLDSTQNISTLTWWLTGLSGAGKTTLAQALAAVLRNQGMSVCVLDGDELRRGLSKDLGFSPQDREEQSRRVAEMAKILNQNGILTIVALISPTTISRNTARAVIGSEKMKEIYISTPLAICQQRDVKGLYARAHQQNDIQLTGIQAAYETPSQPDCEIDTSKVSINDAVEQLLSLYKIKTNVAT